MTPYEVPETVIRRFTENGCEVTAIVADPADAQQTLYGTVTRDGALVGSYYCADRVRQSDWHIVCCPALKMPMSKALCVPMMWGGKTPPDGAAAGFSSVRCRWLSARCRWCQSTTSVTAERAAASSTRFLPEANVATRDCSARLFTARG